MPSFVAIIVGGLGSLPGTLAGGLVIGVASGVTTVFFPSATEAVIYVMMALVLLVRPRGLFGEEGRLPMRAARREIPRSSGDLACAPDDALLAQ